MECSARKKISNKGDELILLQQPCSYNHHYKNISNLCGHFENLSLIQYLIKLDNQNGFGRAIKSLKRKKYCLDVIGCLGSANVGRALPASKTTPKYAPTLKNHNLFNAQLNHMIQVALKTQQRDL